MIRRQLFNLRQQRGIALVIVLWVIALLSVIALGLTSTQRSTAALTRNYLAAAQFRAHAEAAITLTVLNLITRPSDIQVDDAAVWLPDGSTHLLQFDDTELEVQITNEASRLDVNQVTRDQWAILLELAGADVEQLDALADAILDWRDVDDLTQLNGAEDGDYEAAGLSYGARDAPFESVEELGQVLGMTPAVLARLAPDLRVSGTSAGGGVSSQPVFGGHATSSSASNLGFNARFASAAVIAATQNVTYEQALEIIATRDAPPEVGVERTAPTDRGGPQYRLRVTFKADESAQRTTEVLVNTQPGRTPPFVVLWRREAVGLPEPTDNQ
ncbi:general secretion pathway protein GspK [Rhodoferax sp. 4810]|uniref:General secretion pathway protein GspK n=1 Tax=Thiospirillum jenense TaxID=1653858 RepID=A0A839HGG5_9GAMM|nr:type II secretion system protein GspK [Thiospirillum jenense]MBB1073521.1 general secretion pathway protein GspK [Rhodoferax jenense]MBB1126009.1 general secretion pathway protein GspK [Thiospirillum jenense]